MAEIHKVLPSEEDFARMEGELFSRLESSHSRRMHRHRVIAVAAAALIVAGGSVAAGTVVNPTQQTYLTYCYRGSDTTSTFATATTPDVPSNVKSPVLITKTRIDQGLDACSGAWQQGLLGPKSKPALQACIEDNLTVAVFPRAAGDDSSGTQFCDDRGMTAP